MEQQYQEKSYHLFIIWLAAFAAVLVTGTVNTPNIAGLGTIKSMSVLMYMMLDILFVLIYLTESIYWIAGISYEAAAGAGSKARRRFALLNLAVFLTATAIYLVYCFAAVPYWMSGAYWDSLTAGAIVCAAVIFTGRLRL